MINRRLIVAALALAAALVATGCDTPTVVDDRGNRYYDAPNGPSGKVVDRQGWRLVVKPKNGPRVYVDASNAQRNACSIGDSYPACLP
ncbi:hypothetical protein ACLQ2R_19655 [Streptosporangium sp. DT93]|uniref:hypothetical protein n=1 Tax=Streptosporangium sp. DT93 TaxID=3393428 RepID=UPI003CEF4A06